MANTKQLNKEEEISLFQHATGKLAYGLTNDYMFRAIMQKNEKVLRGLIGSLLGISQEEIVSVELTNPIILGSAIGEKESILDLKIILNHDQLLNIEMQVANRGYWVERSLLYLCRNFGRLQSGQDYAEVMPCLHIGIIDFDLFKEEEGFYSRYRLLNVENRRIYSSKFGINVLNLRKTEHATQEDRINELDVWAKLFKAKTWEEIRMLAKTNDFVKEAATSIYAVSEDEAIRLQCEARERYERDWAGSYNSGVRDGIKEGMEAGLKEGKKEGRKEGKKEGNLEAIRNVMKNLQMTEQQAMDALGIPASEQAEYAALLQPK